MGNSSFPIASPHIFSSMLIIQARMNSYRLPGKSLMEIDGKPMLWYIIDSIRNQLPAQEFLVATSIMESDDPIESLCIKEGVKFYRGDLEDVAGRFISAANENDIELIVRVNGDSPLIDMKILTAVLDLFWNEKPDLACNVFPRSFPKGQSVEVFSVQLLKKYHQEMNATEREHVTRFFYENSGRFSIANLSAPINREFIQLSVDELVDLERIRTIVARMDKPHWEYTYMDAINMMGTTTDSD